MGDNVRYDLLWKWPYVTKTSWKHRSLKTRRWFWGLWVMLRSWSDSGAMKRRPGYIYIYTVVLISLVESMKTQKLVGVLLTFLGQLAL